MLGIEYNHYHYITFSYSVSQEKNVTYYASTFFESLAHGYVGIHTSSQNDDHISHVGDIFSMQMHAM